MDSLRIITVCSLLLGLASIGTIFIYPFWGLAGMVFFFVSAHGFNSLYLFVVAQKRQMSRLENRITLLSDKIVKLETQHA